MDLSEAFHKNHCFIELSHEHRFHRQNGPGELHKIINEMRSAAKEFDSTTFWEKQAKFLGFIDAIVVQQKTDIAGTPFEWSS